MELKAIVRTPEETELVAFTLTAADHKQARSFIKQMMPHCFLVSLKKCGWKLANHFDFPLVSHTTHIAKHTAARKKRGVQGLPTYEI